MPPSARSTQQSLALAPGARVEIRGEEWLVRSTQLLKTHGTRLDVIATSELVRGRNASFLSALDPPLVLRPEETDLVADPSPGYRNTRLYLDCLLRRTPPQLDDARIHIGHMAATKRQDYQLQPAVKALGQDRQRILMADGVGLGKTIEVGILLSELIYRGRGDRILVVALNSILAQFQLELWARFAIPLVRLDSVGIQRLRQRIPSNMNPFQVYNRVIVSIDTLKNDAKYRHYLEEAHWDAIVVDECQNVSPRADERSSALSQRARLARLLARTSDALILTSATPHDGTARSFAGLMDLLDPAAIADRDDYRAEEVQHLFIRRFKKDVAHEAGDAFRERDPRLDREAATRPENEVFETLRDVEFRTIARERGGKGMLFRTLLLKAFLSSPFACVKTVRNRLAKDALQPHGRHALKSPGHEDDIAHDRAVLEGLAIELERIDSHSFGKYQKLLTLLRELGFHQKDIESSALTRMP